MVTLFADRQRYREPVSRGRKRAGGIRGVGAGRIFEMIEVENQFAFTVHAMIWQRSIEKPASGIGCFCARRILQNKKQLGALRVFEDRFEAISFSLQRELGVAWHGLIVARSHQRD